MQYDNKNPLIAESQTETMQNVAEAMSALLCLMADRHSDLCRLASPILHAAEHAAGRTH